MVFPKWWHSKLESSRVVVGVSGTVGIMTSQTGLKNWIEYQWMIWKLIYLHSRWNISYCWPFSPNNQHGGYPCMSWSIILSCAKVYRLLSISKLSLGNRMNMGHPWKGKAVPDLMFQHILYWLYFNCPFLFLPVIFRSVVAPTYLNQKETIDPYWLENYIVIRLVPATQYVVETLLFGVGCAR